MKPLRFVIGTAVGAIVLFVWSGLTQFAPWGVSTTHNIYAVSSEPTHERVSDALDVPPHALTTPQFDDEMAHKVTTLTTDETFSWIVSRPVDAYDPAAYLGREALTQLGVGGLLTLLLWLTAGLSPLRRLGVVAVGGVAAGAATYGQLYNWWGLPIAYALGVSVNLVVGWLLAAWVVGRFVVPSIAPTSSEK